MTSPIPDSHRDLLEAGRVAVLTTQNRDGYPQSTAVWFLLDGDVLRTSLHRSRQKYRNLVRNPKATLFVFDPTTTQRTIEVRGDVTIEDDGDRSFLVRLLEKYGTTLEQFRAPHDDRVVVTFTPTRVNTYG